MIKIKRNSHSILISSINFYPFLARRSIYFSFSSSFFFFLSSCISHLPFYQSNNTKKNTSSLFFVPVHPSSIHSPSPSSPIFHERFLHPFSRPHSSQLHFLLHHKYFSMVIDPRNDHLPVTIYL